MAYTCQNCGADAEDSRTLCNPNKKELDSKFCGASAAEVCDDKLSTMKYSCDSCGSVSADSTRLCNPAERR
jgi:hypothetical protein